MKRDLDHEDLRLWAIVASTVRPAHGRALLASPPGEGRSRSDQVEKADDARRRLVTLRTSPPSPSGQPPRNGREVEAIEPRRRHRIVHEREPLAARIDLHGMTHDQARRSLTAFMTRAHDQGWRSVLVITGKGALGDGVLRRHAPDWLAQPPLRPMVAGISQAHRRHGGEGALYVALKRRT
jgi:DNA-nicking Smr family endonuclease